MFSKSYYSKLILCLSIFISVCTLESKAQMNLEFADTLEQTFINFAEENNMNVSSAVIFPDGSTWSSASGKHGNSDLETNMLYDIGSNTKSMTSALILLLEEEGALSIDDTLYHHIDYVANVPYGITLKHLLEQRSGIANYTEDDDFLDQILYTNKDHFWHPDTLLARFLAEPLFEAGANWSYSNTNYLLLGKVIEAVENKPYNEVLRDRLFVPNNLNESFLSQYDDYPLTKTGAWWTSTDYWQDELVGLMSSTWAAGGVVSTPEDFASWSHQLCRGDILSSTAMEKMLTGSNITPNNVYGLGIETQTFSNGKKYLMHGGTTLQNSEMHYSMDTDFSVVVMDLDQGAYYDTYSLQLALIDVLEYVIPKHLSVDENPTAFTIKAFPNPSQNEMQIEIPTDLLEQQLSIEAYDAMGRLVFQQQCNETHTTLHKSDFGTGLFMINIIANKQLIDRKKVTFY